MNDGPQLIQGATHTAIRITWLDAKRVPYNLTGATLSGRKRLVDAETGSDLTGTFTLVTAASGIFTYQPSAEDVAESGIYDFQFIATYGDSTKDKTFTVRWEIGEAI